MKVTELETPVVTVALDVMEANIARAQTYFDQHHIANRPHAKTHKIPAIAQMQLEAGAVGITCQKVGEAEVFARAGIHDIFIPYNVIGAQKLERLMQLARAANLSITADSEYVVRGLSDAARAENLTLTTLVECDTGMGRCGVQSPDAAADLAQLIARAPGLYFGGLMTYPNSAQFDTFMAETKARLARRGISVERVSGGGTGCMWQAHTHPDLTEHRAGEYIYGDRYQIQAGAMTVDDCSFRITTTVVSRPTASRAILDAGSKTLSSDAFVSGGHGILLEYPDATIYSLSEEHGHVDVSACARKPEIGERLTIVPNHCCTITNLMSRVYGIRNGQVESVWDVAARGAVQ